VTEGYTFGDAALAAEQLALVAAVFASRMFALNLEVWRSTALEHGLAGAAELDELADDLTGLLGHPNTQHVRWLLRQLVIRA
jgi:hypothetical protein